MHAGGERYEYISALNDRPEHIDALATLVEKNLTGWSVETVDEHRQLLAQAHGAKD